MVSEEHEQRSEPERKSPFEVLRYQQRRSVELSFSRKML